MLPSSCLLETHGSWPVEEAPNLNVHSSTVYTRVVIIKGIFPASADARQSHDVFTCEHIIDQKRHPSRRLGPFLPVFLFLFLFLLNSRFVVTVRASPHGVTLSPSQGLPSPFLPPHEISGAISTCDGLPTSSHGAGTRQGRARVALPPLRQIRE